jgi:predicted nucleotidyltransferase
MNKHINQKYQDAIVRALEYHFPNAKIILFGSRARATHKEGADVDVAVDTGGTHPTQGNTKSSSNS